MSCQVRGDRTLYEYLYQSLISQFLNGAFLPGRKFPSQREICQQYNVGITTVRKVMRMLDEEGYLHTAQGQPAVVIYRASAEANVAFLVQRRDEIADAYRGLGYLMPALYRKGAKRCGEAEFQLLQEIVDSVVPEMELAALYRQANAFFTTLLRPLNNLLIMDLELDSENYLHVPYIPFTGMEDPFALTAEKLLAWLENAVTQIRERRFDAFHDSAVTIYREAAKRVDDYILALGRLVPMQTQTKSDVHWFRTKGRCELYVRLAAAILRRIIDGEFDDQKYLSSIPKLMEEYGVTKDTASRAVDLLNALGLVRTIDKKGTVITANGIAKAAGSLGLTEPVIQERWSLFEDALQIVALTANDCAALISSVPERLTSLLEDRLAVQDHRCVPLSFQLLMNGYIQQMPVNSLKNIFQQLEELILWGFYLQTVDRRYYPDPARLAAAMRAAVSAMKAPGSHSLPDALKAVFSQAYQDVSAVVSQLSDP